MKIGVFALNKPITECLGNVPPNRQFQQTTNLPIVVWHQSTTRGI